MQQRFNALMKVAVARGQAVIVPTNIDSKDCKKNVDAFKLDHLNIGEGRKYQALINRNDTIAQLKEEIAILKQDALYCEADLNSCDQMLNKFATQTNNQQFRNQTGGIDINIIKQKVANKAGIQWAKDNLSIMGSKSSN